MAMSDLVIGIELSGIPATDRGRGRYLVSELRRLGYNAVNITEKEAVDIRVMLSRDFSRARNHSEIRIFDVSDAILSPPVCHSMIRRIYQMLFVNRKIIKFISECDAVVVASKLQQAAMNRYNDLVYLIPDSSYYHKRYDPRGKPDVERQIVFVWDGQGSNFHYLESIIAKNVDFFRRNDVLLKVITDRIDQVNNIDNEIRLKNLQVNAKFIEWGAETFMDEVNAAHVGLAPVDLECPFASAKPDNKIVNYQGLGLPVIASATMSYNDFAVQSPGGVITCKTDADWKNALEYWRVNRKNVIDAGMQGREYVLDNYKPAVLARKWERVILDLTN